MTEEIYGCEIMNAMLPEDTMADWLGRGSVEVDEFGAPVWRLIRCEILRARTTDEQRQELKDDGHLIELTYSQWLTKAASAQYTNPEEE